MPLFLVLVTQPYLWLSPNRILKKKSTSIDFAYSPAVWSGVTGEGSLLLFMVSLDRVQLGTGGPASRTTPSQSPDCHREAQPQPSPPGPQRAWLSHSTVSGESWTAFYDPASKSPRVPSFILATFHTLGENISRFKRRTLNTGQRMARLGKVTPERKSWVEYKIHDYSYVTPGMLPPRAWPLLSLCLEYSSLRYALGPYSQ